MNQARLSQPRRLRRLDQIWAEGGYARYFLTICVQDRRPVLANEPIHVRLLSFLTESADRYGWWPGRYVLMPDHIHLLVQNGNARVSIGAWVKALKAIVGRREFDWQTGFFDHVLRSRESASAKWEYVRQNPVRAGLVAMAEAWPYAGIVDQREVESSTPAPAEGSGPTTTTVATIPAAVGRVPSRGGTHPP